MRGFRVGFLARVLLTAGLALTLAGCFEPGNENKPPVETHDPLDSLLGYYDGTIARTICKQPNLPAPDSCGLLETDTLPAVTSRISQQGILLSFFLPGFGSIWLAPGDTTFVDSADQIGTVTCFYIAEPTWEPGSGGPTVGGVPHEHAEGGAICRDTVGSLTVFTIRPKNDPRLLTGQLRTFRLHRAPPPTPPQ